MHLHVTSFNLCTGQDPRPSTLGDIAGSTEDSEIGDNVVSYCNTLGATPLLGVGLVVLISNLISQESVILYSGKLSREKTFADW